MANMITTTTHKPPLKLPLRTRIKLVIFSLGSFFGIRRDGTVNQLILRLIDIKAPAPSTKRINRTTTVSTSDIMVDKSRNLWFRLYVPNTSDKPTTTMPLVVYFHGGGFIVYGSDSKSSDDFCSNLAAQANAVIASVNYRLAPEYKYPSQYDDGLDTLKFIDQHNYAILPLSTDVKTCFVAGESAGGNIAHHVALRFCQKSNEFEKMNIAGVLLFQPFFGGEERTESELMDHNQYLTNLKLSDLGWRSFLPEGADRNHHAACVYGCRENSDTAEELKSVEFPRCLIMVGGYDPLQDWQRRYVEWLRHCGKQVELIEYPNAFHGVIPTFPELPEHDLMINDAAKFIHKQARS